MIHHQAILESTGKEEEERENSLSVDYSDIVLQNVDVANDIDSDGSNILDADLSVDSINSRFDSRLEESCTNYDFDGDDDDDVRESAFDSISDSCSLDIDATNNGDICIETDKSLHDFSIHSSVFESDNIDL